MAAETKRAGGDFIPEVRFPDIELSEKRITLTFDQEADARLFQRWLSMRSGRLSHARSGWAAFGDFVDSQP